LYCQYALVPELMATGTVVSFDDTGGYGVIECGEADEDVFGHTDDIEGPDLEEGEELDRELFIPPRPRSRR
jgi:CspA family cold shock protein